MFITAGVRICHEDGGVPPDADGQEAHAGAGIRCSAGSGGFDRPFYVRMGA